MSAQITAALIGLALAGSILYLVRRDHLHGPYALWWLVVAAATLVLGFVPRTIDWLAHLTGIAYPPVLPLIIGVSLILLRLLQLDIERSRQERQIRRLNQKLAILEEELASLHKAQRAKAAKAPA
ncbi:DUF2304 domain-containing protein [Tahibacter harae]|uniref:DUF2304 domain-containing protein n=1 Tax=Tahibacter harae TaxID=2963937 RepID=A0ABT1QXZ1_9GAMM|nr:DUF2304 domain-containing protein [Tahibacter harae]MCQ4167160.1 DUF2304 domain-containing protein [Tahibacter harae]